ncbi:lysine exporter protein LysE/YggA [Nitratireductor indicus C115]|uniref:Lysine exporter protein LysE/YggA n=1 Tax=Nitratireductor indicus C115 TaxID=1231190 RepID=K2MZG4_9HYPH|nr:LysE family translocator [Nitratireductor indicus]EKF40593.1 lysine exporter protein LysE/YggA [Nitratireductor indicus C115]SFQ44075.1 Threonine/homoserine/homoserine lactone efflux protein [Nitratireductor indicus]
MLELAIALIVFLFPLAYSPGPGNMFFAANGARFGLKATFPANAGYHLATWSVTAAIGLGFAAILEAQPGFFTVIKWAGSAYVLYLAYRLYRAGAAGGGEDARPAGFMDGVILLLLNPKAYVIIALMFSQFLAGRETDHLVAVLLIATVFTLNNFVAFIVWTLAGDRIALRFRDPGQARRLNAIFAFTLAAVAIWMLL